MSDHSRPREWEGYAVRDAENAYATRDISLGNTLRIRDALCNLIIIRFFMKTFHPGGESLFSSVFLRFFPVFVERTVESVNNFG